MTHTETLPNASMSQEKTHIDIWMSPIVVINTAIKECIFNLINDFNESFDDPENPSEPFEVLRASHKTSFINRITNPITFEITIKPDNSELPYAPLSETITSHLANYGTIIYPETFPKACSEVITKLQVLVDIEHNTLPPKLTRVEFDHSPYTIQTIPISRATTFCDTCRSTQHRGYQCPFSKPCTNCREQRHEELEHKAVNCPYLTTKEKTSLWQSLPEQLRETVITRYIQQKRIPHYLGQIEPRCHDQYREQLAEATSRSRGMHTGGQRQARSSYMHETKNHHI